MNKQTQKRTDIDEVQDIMECIESNIRGYQILDGDDESIILRSERTGCNFEILIKTIESDEN